MFCSFILEFQGEVDFCKKDPCVFHSNIGFVPRGRIELILGRTGNLISICFPIRMRNGLYCIINTEALGADGDDEDPDVENEALQQKGQVKLDGATCGTAGGDP